jgi:hypothetical protein
MAAAVAQHAAERELFVTGELAAASRPNKLVVSVCVPRRSPPFLLTLCLVRAPRSSAEGALRIVRHELEVALGAGRAENSALSARRFHAALVCRSFAQHPTTMYFPHLVGDACSREPNQLGERCVGPERQDSAGMRLLTAVVGVIFPADEEATLPIVASAALITPGSALRMSPLLRLNPTLNRPHGKLGREGIVSKRGWVRLQKWGNMPSYP